MLRLEFNGLPFNETKFENVLQFSTEAHAHCHWFADLLVLATVTSTGDSLMRLLYCMNAAQEKHNPIVAGI